MMRLLLAVMLGGAVSAAVGQSMGTVASKAAKVTGGLEVQGDSVRLVSNASVTAYDQAAPIELTRGGEVLVCATSEFHLLRAGMGNSLVFALDRGAVEIRSRTEPQDVLLTPDLRFTLAATGDLDLRVRVTREGDTCVENAGVHAPGIQIADVFGEATYHLNAGQHVLFEHGSLHEVVDRETSSCGCPGTVLPLAMLAKTPGQATSAEIAAAEHPFPAAVSQGLTPAGVATNVAPVGEKGTQVTAVLAVGGAPDSTAEPAPASPVVPGVAVAAEPPPAPPGAGDLVHAVGRFWRRLFHKRSGVAGAGRGEPAAVR